jgi:hypothetical protein
MKSLKVKAVLAVLYGILLQLAVYSQNTYIKPKLSNKDSWSVIMLPDPQSYVKFARNQPIFDLMTSWIADNIDTLNIKMVVITGDLVEQNEMINPAPPNGDQTSLSQWRAVSGGFSKLDGKVPYVVCAGNHDYGYSNISVRRSNLGKYFTADRNFLNKKMIREVAPNAEGVPTLENAAYEFSSPAGKKFLLISLEFAPRDTILAWAKTVSSQEKYKDHSVIILTHSYVNSKNEHIVKENYPVGDGNYGAAMFKKLVQPSRNIRMVLSGHICDADKPEEHVGFRTDLNAAGKKVQQMAFNAQALGGGWYGNGGDGWLRILEFLPDGKTVNVKTFSPLFAISPTTQQFAWGSGVFKEFSFQLD